MLRKKRGTYTMYNQPYNPYNFGYNNNFNQPNTITPNYNLQAPQGLNKPNFDFNGKWVNSIEEVEQINNENLPVISLDRNKNMFYMRVNNEVKAYEFKEVKIQTPQEKEIEDLKAQISALNSTIETLNTKMAQTPSQNQNNYQNQQNGQNKKGGNN